MFVYYLTHITAMVLSPPPLPPPSERWQYCVFELYSIQWGGRVSHSDCTFLHLEIDAEPQLCTSSTASAAGCYGAAAAAAAAAAAVVATTVVAAAAAGETVSAPAAAVGAPAAASARRCPAAGTVEGRLRRRRPRRPRQPRLVRRPT